MRSNMLANPKVRVGVIVLGLFVLVAIFAPLILGWLGLDPRANDIAAIGQSPSADHLLGTTQFGQDVLAQTIAGTRGSLYVGFLGAIVGTTLAIAIGVPAGYLSGAAGGGFGFLINLFLVMPVLPLIFVVAGYVHGAGLTAIALIIGVFGWAGGARTLRAQAMSVSSRDYVHAMRMLGERNGRVAFVEVLPHLTGLIASMFLHSFIAAVMAEAGLAFLGVSDSSSISWGTMIQEAQGSSAVLRGMWWWFVPPGLCIALVGTAASLINFGVDELANPKLRAAARVRKPRAARRQATVIPAPAVAR